MRKLLNKGLSQGSKFTEGERKILSETKLMEGTIKIDQQVLFGNLS